MSRGRPTPPASAMVCVGDHPWDRRCAGQSVRPSNRLRRQQFGAVTRAIDVGPLTVWAVIGRRSWSVLPEWLLQRSQDKAFTLRGLVGELAERGLSVDCRVVWQFVHDENLSYKKGHSSPASATPGRSAAVPTMDDLSCSH